LKCENCGNTFTRGTGTVIHAEKGREIGICLPCHGDIYRNASRYSVDVMIVPISEDSFRFAIDKKKYVSPSWYVRKRKPKFIAFYRVGEIGAITHIARVVDFTPNVPKEELAGILESQPDSEWMSSEEFNIFQLADPLGLEHEIRKSDYRTVQGRTYTTFKKFAKARELKDIIVSRRTE